MFSVGACQWTVFVGSFLVVAAWESRRPRRDLDGPASRRWTTHGILFAVTVVALAVVLRVTPLAAAISLDNSGGKGLLLTLRDLGAPVGFAATFAVFDLTAYLVHRLFHAVPLLWRIHEIHHSDPDFDVSTGLRFHPLDTAATTMAHVALVALLAPPWWAVFGAQLIEMAMNFLVHANAALPRHVDRAMRYLLVTPDVHRIHHSADSDDYSRNFGQSLTIWDRTFRTLLDEPALGHEKMTTGVPQCRREDCLRLNWMLVRPFLPGGGEGLDQARGWDCGQVTNRPEQQGSDRR